METIKHFVITWIIITVQHLPTTQMPADILTKALPRVTVEVMREMLGLMSR